MAFLVSGLIDLGVLAVYLHRHRPAAASRRGSLVLLTVCLTLGLAAGLSGALPAAAHADTTEPSILMDDYAFIYSSPARVEHNLEQVAALGVNTIKVSMVWSLVAPDPNSRTKPDFNATDPSAYPSGAWSRYDTLVQDAAALGLNVYFQLTAPAPLWATTPGATGKEHPWSHEPNAQDFEQFVQAVGARYNGEYPVPGSSASSSSNTGVLGTLTDPLTAASSEPQPTLPAVHMWGIWNEPNEIGWLSPQTVRVDGRTEPKSPALERNLIDAGYKALVETGHAMDTILIGETASGGNTHTIPFLDALFCVNSAAEPLSGRAATREGCPSSANTRQFVVNNPGLFAATGWAHHPYSFDHAPDTVYKTEPWLIMMDNLRVLGSALDRIDATYGEPTGMPIYITEWGYKSNPPNPFVKTTLGQQETWLDEGWYMSYLMPRVKAMAQELLYDQPPISGKRPGTAAYWANFDSGLEFDDGDPKPSYDAFRLPIWLPSQRPGSHVTVWAEIRPAQVASNATGVLEFEPHGSSKWRSLTDLTTTSPEGFILSHVAIPGAGKVRLAWADPAAGQIYYSRTVPID